MVSLIILRSMADLHFFFSIAFDFFSTSSSSFSFSLDFVWLSLSQSAWNIFAISPQVCRCVVALCIIKNMHTIVHTSTVAVLVCAVRVWVSYAWYLYWALSSVLRVWHVGCHFPTPSFFVFSSVSVFSTLSCSRVHVHTIARATHQYQIQSRFRFVCVRVRACIHTCVVPHAHTSNTVRRPDGAVFCSFPCNISCACIVVCRRRIRANPQHYKTSRLLMGKRLENIEPDKFAFTRSSRKRTK